MSLEVKRETTKYEEEKAKLAALFADGKIGEKSYLTATKTLESRIEELRTEGSLLRSQEAEATLRGLDEFEKAVNPAAAPTALWYLVPFFFGIIGGIVAYVGTKDEDKGMADSLLVFGIIWTIIGAVIYFAVLSAIFARF